MNQSSTALPGFSSALPNAIVPCFSNANPTFGEVRRHTRGCGWQVRFAFQVKWQRTVFNGPLRRTYEDAEFDRQVVASSISQLNQTLRPDAALRTLVHLHSSVVSKVGQVIQGRDGWNARFQFRLRGKRVSFIGPCREDRGIAETDRAKVAALIAPLQRSLKPSVAERSLRSLFANGSESTDFEAAAANASLARNPMSNKEKMQSVDKWRSTRPR